MGSAGGTATKRILVVDADPAVGAWLEGVLGHRVTSASHLAQAQALVRSQPFDAVLVARELESDGGTAFLRWLADVQPACLRMLVSDDTDSESLIGTLNRGDVSRVIDRPLEARQVIAALTEAFDAARRAETAATERLIESHRQERRWFDETVTGDLLRLAIQPIVLLEGDVPVVVAYEALLRPQHHAWDNPVQVLIVAERLARVDDLSARVFQLAATQIQQIPAPIRLFVNLHPLQLSDPDRLLRDLAPLIPYARRITLEITERAHPGSAEGWELAVEKLVAHGFSLAIDDLGAGSAGLVMLASLQPEVIKLDMSLVRGIQKSPRKRRLIQLLATFAEATGATLLAEGVESNEEFTALRACGVSMMQGYLFGRPSFSTVG